jgi:hypothetical protein
MRAPLYRSATPPLAPIFNAGNEKNRTRHSLFDVSCTRFSRKRKKKILDSRKLTPFFYRFSRGVHCSRIAQPSLARVIAIDADPRVTE